MPKPSFPHYGNVRWDLSFPDDRLVIRFGCWIDDVIRPKETPIAAHFWAGPTKTPLASTALYRAIQQASRRHVPRKKKTIGV